MNYLFYDDETANTQMRICSLGYEVVSEDGDVLDSFYTLINPESEFHYMNISVHGIMPDDVVDAPIFPDIYEEKLKSLLETCVFVSHSARRADIPHIRKSLKAYGLELPGLTFIDTYEMAVQLFEKNHRGLKPVCDHYQIDIGRHHHALDDARACKEIFYKMSEQLGNPEAISLPAGYTGSSKGSRKPSNAIYGSDQSFLDILDELEQESLRADLSEITSIADMKIVVSGFADGYTRDSIKDALETKGAKPTGSVSKKTSILAIGPNASLGKIKQARELNVPVVSTEELTELLDRI